MKDKLSYKKSGVDIKAGEESVSLMKESVKRTLRPEVISDLGGFGGLFALDTAKYQQPVLVSGTDGVGTKLKLAFMMDKHDTIGRDAVAMCVNDVLVTGAEPLFFLDYLSVGKMIPEKVAEIVAGVAGGCEEAGCSLVGGETAEMPGFYPAGEYDLAGFVVGVVEKEKIIDGKNIVAGDILLGLSSSGLHSNGFSLVRKLFLELKNWSLDKYIESCSCTLGEELIKPTRIYVKSVQKLLAKVKVKGMAHITGGGLTENIPRVIPDGLGVEIERNKIVIPPIFELIQQEGDVAVSEMYRTFNMGIGMVIIVSKENATIAKDYLTEAGEKVCHLGTVVKGSGVTYKP